MSEQSKPPGPTASAWKDSLAGMLAGMGQLLVGHPFDTIKVRLQTQPAPVPGQTPQFSGAMDCVRKTVSREGPLALYKGMGLPLASVGVFNSVLFSVFGQAKEALGDSTGASLSTHQIGLAGIAAGCAVTLVAGPTELVKARLQVQYGPAGGAGSAPIGDHYKGPMDCAVKVVRRDGPLGLFRGFTPTLLREGLGNYFYFAAYETLKRALTPPGETKPGALGSMMAGGGAGVAIWLVMYPADVVKSKMQTDLAGEYRTTLGTFQTVLAREGWRGMYRGFGPCVARAFPANAACFAVYEAASHALAGI
eukprot:tig00000601_g2293.t1